jgi:hypothetical protein
MCRGDFSREDEPESGYLAEESEYMGHGPSKRARMGDSATVGPRSFSLNGTNLLLAPQSEAR